MTTNHEGGCYNDRGGPNGGRSPYDQGARQWSQATQPATSGLDHQSAFADRVRARAHQLWVDAGEPTGSENHFWLAAEDQLWEELTEQLQRKNELLEELKVDAKFCAAVIGCVIGVAVSMLVYVAMG